MEEKYQEALALYNQCDYEGAYTIIIDNGLCSTEKGDFLCNECRKQILQQYIYLIKDYIAQEMYIEAKDLRQQYYSLYGFSSDLSGIVIPEPIQPIETEERTILEQDKIIQEVNENITEEKSGFLKKNIIPVMCIVSLLIGLVGYLVYYYNFNEDYIIGKKTEELKRDSNKQIVMINSGSAFYTQSDKDSLYILNLLTDSLEKIPLEIINEKGEWEGGIYSLKEAFSINNNEIIFIGDNGGNSIFGGDNVLKYDIAQKQLKYVCYGRVVKHGDGKLIVTYLDILKEGASHADTEYFSYDIYCDYEGNKIDGYTISEEGMIGKYPIKMFFHCLDGKITGWYRYDGRDNHMTIKGQMKENDGFSFIEYDEKGKAFATFTGKANFEKETLHGVFSRDGRNLNFWIGDLIDVVETMGTIDKATVNHMGITMEHPIYFQEINQENNRGNIRYTYKCADMMLSYMFLSLPGSRQTHNKDIMDLLLKSMPVEQTLTSAYDEEGAYSSVFKSGNNLVLSKVFNKEYKSYGIIILIVPTSQEKLLYMMDDRKLINYRVG